MRCGWEVFVALHLIQFADINMQQLNDTIALFYFFDINPLPLVIYTKKMVFFRSTVEIICNISVDASGSYTFYFIEIKGVTEALTDLLRR